MKRIGNLVLVLLLAVMAFGCSMSEEIKRIAQTKMAQQRQEASTSTNLTGEQLFIRSCNTCHPQGRAGFGPSLENISNRYSDQAIKDFIRKGKGMMPAQPKSVINDQELDNLVDYVKTL